MDTSRMSQGQMIAGGAGVLLIIFLFLPWLGIEGGDNLSGWKSSNTFDVFLLITGVVAIAAALTAGGGIALPGVTMNGASAVLGMVATLLVLWLLIFDFPDGFDRKIGIFLSLIAVAGIAFGSYSAAQEEGGSAERY
jgi:drug/metabolite transporter (DMT)-like permease